MKRITAADNIDLFTILQEYETFYSLKFGRTPKLVRKVSSNDSRLKVKSKDAMTLPHDVDPLPKIRQNSNQKPDRKKKVVETETTSTHNDVGIIGTSVGSVKSTNEEKSAQKESPDETLYENKLLKPMPGFGNSEFRELAAIISRDIFIQNPNVHWDDIAGLEESKRLIKEAVVFPLKYPAHALF